jgi:cell division septation protein DedD
MLLRNRIRTHSGRAFVFCPFAMALCLFALLVSFAPMHARAQDDSTAPEQHGRKYKAPPETSRIEVTVLKGFNKKPIINAAVVFHPSKDGRDEGNMEMKTDPDGKAVIDIIPTGSKVTIQVIADGFATFAEDYQVNEASRQIVISLLRPRAQISAYIDNSGKPAELKPGVQDPVRPTPKTKPATPSTPSAPSSTAPGTSPTPSSPSTPSGTAPKP